MQCFKKYDVRGIVGSELTEDIAHNIGKALARVSNGKNAVVGCDARASSPALKSALIDGLTSCGVDVFDLGITGTEEVYFACQHLDTDIGVEITASHNPIEYNGIKFVAKGAKPFNNEQFQAIKQFSQQYSESELQDDEEPGSKAGSVTPYDHLPAFVDHLINYVDLPGLKPMRIVVNAGNGVAGHVIDVIEARFAEANVPISFVKIFHEPDSEFPNGIPNPLLEHDRWKTTQAIVESNADLGIAWDGDFDRCFFFDENGHFIDGYYIVALLARSFLSGEPGTRIVHDPRVFWNTKHVVESNGGQLVKSATGHALIKATMREHDAIYGGEMSAHHYFKSFGYCDSGMIPWLLVVKLLSQTGQSISETVSEMQSMFPSSGEINFKVADVQLTLERIQSYYSETVVDQDMFDGLSMTFEDWRFNLRSSATEPVLRLNLETKGQPELLSQKKAELTHLITQQN